VNIQFIIKVNIIWVIKWPCRSPPLPQFMFPISSRKSTNLKTLAISFHHVVFWCSSLDSHPTIHPSNIRDACVVTLFLIIKCLYLIGTWFNENEKNKHQKTNVEKRLYTSIIYPTHTRKDLCSHIKNQQTCCTSKNQRRSDFQSNTRLRIGRWFAMPLKFFFSSEPTWLTVDGPYQTLPGLNNFSILWAQLSTPL
jgi:hypothetical protein